MTVRTTIASPVAIVRNESWTYDKGTPQAKTVQVVAHRSPGGQFAGGRFGNGARRSR